MEKANAKVRKGEAKGYCSDCGSWAIDCETVMVYGIPEKVCKNCRKKMVR